MAVPKPTPTIPFTQTAYEKLQHDYARLQQERTEVMERLKTAREMGDLSENGAYKYAKFELGSISRQLRQLKHLLANGYIKESNSSTNKVEFGTRVTLQHDSEVLEFLLVTAHESDLSQNKLSLESPLGKSLLNKSVGDTITVEAPAGIRSYKVLKIA